MAKDKITAAHNQQTRLIEAGRENLREIHRLSVNKDLLIQLNEDSENRQEKKRNFRRYNLIKQEEAIELALNERQLSKELYDQKQAEEAETKEREKKEYYDKMREEKVRQQVREESYEIRELETKLRIGYLNKERQAQIREKQEKVKNDIDEDLKYAEQVNNEVEEASKAEDARERVKAELAEKYQRELENQLLEIELNKRESYEIFLKEKEMIDEQVRKIWDEDQLAREEAKRKKEEDKKFIQEFKDKRAELKRTTKQTEMEEDDRIRQFRAAQEKREEERLGSKADKADKLQQVQELLGRTIQANQSQREEREALIQELDLAEREENELNREVAEKEKRIRTRIEMQRHHELQMKCKQERLAAEQEEEEFFRQQTLAKYAEDDRIEQMNATRRRMKQLEHKRAVEELIKEQRERAKARREAEDNEKMKEEEKARIRQSIIEDIRKELLDEHAEKLIGYLPKGVFKDHDDVERLGLENTQITEQ